MVFTCNHCPKQFATVQGLRSHLTDVDNVGKFKCDECGRTFKRPAHLREHLKTHRSDDAVFFNCPTCDYRTRFEHQLARHVQFGHDEEGKPVRNGEEHVVLQELHRHFTPINNKFTCATGSQWDYVVIDTCFFIHDEHTLVLFEVDEQQHSDATKYTPVNEVVRMQEAVKVIRLTYPTQPLVWVRFNPNTFRNHLSREHPVLSDTVTAVVEQIKAMTVPLFPVSVVYVNYDVNSAGFPNVVKDRSYPAEWVVATHSWSFFGDKRNTVSLDIPEDVVTTSDGGAGANTCSVEGCGRTFAKPLLLQRHIAEVHQGVQRTRFLYQCDQCDHEPFTQSHNLATHVQNVHGAGNMFKCAGCSKVFNDKGRCREHEKRVHMMHGFQPLKCVICGYTTVYTQMLKKHMSQEHNQQ